MVAGIDLGWLQACDKARLNQIKHESAAAQFATGRRLLRQALQSRDLSYNDVDFSTEKPTHPAIHFNISHVSSLVAVAIGENELGLDVETTVRRTDIDLLMPRQFTPAEIQWVLGQSDRRRAFFRVWTLKEAFIKLLGTGFRTSTKSFEFNLESGEFFAPLNTESSGFYYADLAECCLAVATRAGLGVSIRDSSELKWTVLGRTF